MTARKFALYFAAGVVALGAIAPLLNANRFRRQIQSALESSLNRRVSMGKVHFNVFTGPGFTMDDVLIDEAPGMGIEPFAHVESLTARIRLTSLWTGRLAFSNLTLVSPSVNFVKSDAGPWNIQPLLNRAKLASAAPNFQPPEIQISEGRLNFKFGDTKSVFYLSNADLDIYPNEKGELVIRFSGEPARTDHAARGLGRLVARGVLRSKSNLDDEIGMSVQLERTALQEIARLLGIQDVGVRGFAASNLKLDGPLSKINISGDLRIEDIHRWDLMPNKGEGWTLNYAGFLDVPCEQVNIETRPADPQGSPVDGKFSATRYLTNPQWSASFRFHDLPAAGLVETARHMGAQFPAGATVDGKLNGGLEYSSRDGMSGQLVLNGASFKLPQGGVTEFASAPVEILGNAVKLGPAEIQFGEDQSARVEAGYAFDSHALTLGVETKLLGTGRTKDLMAHLIGAGSVPFLERCRQGAWKGLIGFARTGEGVESWTGNFDVQNVQTDLPGLAAPVRLNAASVDLRNGLILLNHMRGRVGAVAFEGDYRYSLTPGRPGRMRLSIPELRLAELEQLFLPTLKRQPSLLARALGLAHMPIPDWLKSRNLEGSVQIGMVRVGDMALGQVKGRLVWEGARVSVLGLESKLEAMLGSGRIWIDLRGALPQYKLSGEMQGIEYRGGTLDLSGLVDTRGLGMDLALNARSEGAFSGSSLALGPEMDIDRISGDYRAEGSSLGLRLSLSKVDLTQGDEMLHGQGGTQADGRLILELSGPARKQVRMTGMLLPLHANP